MRSQRKAVCSICGEEFPTEQLMPLELIRPSVLSVARVQYPNINASGRICSKDLAKLNTKRAHEVLKKEKGTLSDLEKEVIDSLKKEELLSENIEEEFHEHLSFGDRLADKVAQFGGSWAFILTFMFILMIWMAVNTFILTVAPFDPYPYIFLNLILSCLAAIQAPVIMMSQNRQSVKDRLKVEHDYQVNLKAELQTRQLNSRLDLFMKFQWEKMQELTKLVASLSQHEKTKR